MRTQGLAARSTGQEILDFLHDVQIDKGVCPDLRCALGPHFRVTDLNGPAEAIFLFFRNKFRLLLHESARGS
jgi:hypothetical protein